MELNCACLVPRPHHACEERVWYTLSAFEFLGAQDAACHVTIMTVNVITHHFGIYQRINRSHK